MWIGPGWPGWGPELCPPLFIDLGLNIHVKGLKIELKVIVYSF